MTFNKIKSLQISERRHSGVHNVNEKQTEKSNVYQYTICLVNFLAAGEIHVIRCDAMKFSEIRQLQLYCVVRIPVIACYFSLKLYLSWVFVYSAVRVYSLARWCYALFIILKRLPGDWMKK